MLFEPALGTAFAFIMLFSYVGFKRVAGYAWLADILVFAICLWAFSGTYAGMVCAMFSGVIVSVFLKAIRRSAGYEVIRFRRGKGRMLPTPRWVHLR